MLFKEHAVLKIIGQAYNIKIQSKDELQNIYYHIKNINN
jgi:hypothetical protein